MVFIGNSISYKFRQTKTQKSLSCNLQETFILPLIMDTFDGFFVAQLDWYVTRIEKNPSEASMKMQMWISQRSFAQKLVWHNSIRFALTSEGLTLVTSASLSNWKVTEFRDIMYTSQSVALTHSASSIKSSS